MRNTPLTKKQKARVTRLRERAASGEKLKDAEIAIINDARLRDPKWFAATRPDPDDPPQHWFGNPDMSGPDPADVMYPD